MKALNSILVSIFLTVSLTLSGQTYEIKSVPNPRTTSGGFISDPGKFLSDLELSKLNSSLVDLEKKTSAEFAIVILPSIGSRIPKEFAVELFNTWGIGKKNKDNGLLLLLVMDQRRWEFETGYGLEGVLPDAVLKRIGEDELVPNLKKKDYNAGFFGVIAAVTKKISHDSELVTPHSAPTTNPLSGETILGETEKYKTPFLQKLNIFFSAYFAYIIPIYAILFYSGASYLKKRKGKKSSILFSEYLVNWKLVAIGLIPLALHSLLVSFFWYYVHIVDLCLPSYVFISISSLFFLFRYYLGIDKQEYKDPYEYYKKIDSSFRSTEMIAISFLFPLPSLLFIAWILYKRRKLRHANRICPKCNIEMLRLDEDKDDFFLKDGQRVEEKIGSIDYDVWFCEKSKDIKIYAYESLFTSYSKCPSCKYKTYFVESDTVTVSPTCTSSGSGIRHYACKNCNHTSSSTYTIPARDCSKSSSSSSSSYSSSSSSSSSSFGGGRSGGGGAGGSW